MGLRAYLMVEVADDMDQEQFVDTLRELEEMAEVDFVDPVVGHYDMVIVVEAPVTVEQTASKIQSKKWVKNMDIVRIVSFFERHRASKTELLQGLPHSGLKDAAI